MPDSHSLSRAVPKNHSLNQSQYLLCSDHQQKGMLEFSGIEGTRFEGITVNREGKVDYIYDDGDGSFIQQRSVTEENVPMLHDRAWLHVDVEVNSVEGEGQLQSMGQGCDEIVLPILMTQGSVGFVASGAKGSQIHSLRSRHLAHAFLQSFHW